MCGIVWGGKLHHTRTEAYVEGCSWSRTAAYNRFAAASTSLSPIPVPMEGIWVAKVIEFLVMEDWLQGEGAYYGGLVQVKLATMRGRNLEVPKMPVNEATANPVSN